MSLEFYNTLTNKKEEFKPIEDKVVKMYNCGPTVYSYAHIGNFRSFVFADLLRRYLEYKGYEVKQVMNITDVGHMTQDEVTDSAGEDKIEKAAKEQEKKPIDIARFYEKAFLEDSKKMRIKEPMKRPRATDHIQEMIDMDKKLLENGYAYEVNGNVYFDVHSFEDYGKLSGNSLKELEAGKSAKVKEEKKNPLDFALWVTDPEHLMKWDSPWGEGYPGWHIECSAMSTKYLGNTIDIHTGGEDNIFPHHECEIAQTEGAKDCKFVNYWLHVRHLFVEGEKMSKSEGNFYTLRDIFDKGYSPLALRYVLISAQYRKPLNFTFKALDEAEKKLESLREFLQRLNKDYTEGSNEEMEEVIEQSRKNFESAMDDDLNTPLAISVINTFIKEINRQLDKGIGKQDSVNKVKQFMNDIDQVLAIVPQIKEVDLTEEQKEMIEKREKLREKGNYDKADEIRDKLKEQGIILQDTEDGVKIKKGDNDG